MIAIRPTRTGREVCIRCDECKALIADRGLAVVVAGPNGRPLFACKGLCHQATERKFPSTAEQGFYELTDFLEQVSSPPATR